MNILFLTIVRVSNIMEKGIYTDLLRKFRDEGHRVFIICPTERIYSESTQLLSVDDVNILKIKTLNIQKTNLIEKGIATLLLEQQFYRGVEMYFGNIKFDLILYSTPPITFTKLVRAIKKRDGAKSYLLLKDIFPQNAVDLGMMKKNGILHRLFRQKESLMYALSDFIGCMSPANVDYLLKHNPQIPIQTVEVCPNSIQIDHMAQIEKDSSFIREQYNINENATIFIYGGNLGKPQGLDFLLEVLASNKNKLDRFFIIIGSGTEWNKISKWFRLNNISNAILLNGLPKLEYDKLVKACDVGLIFLDKRFTIPNYPSRLLSYLEYKMPILAATDLNSDLGSIASVNKFGFFCENGNLDDFNILLNKFVGNQELIKEMGNNAYQFLSDNYTVDNSYQIIMKNLSENV